MNYASQYRTFIDIGSRITKGSIQPYGLYKLSTYKYVDEGRKTLRGSEETLIFVTGIYEKKVQALKLSNIPPVKFLRWFKQVANNTYKDSGLDQIPLYSFEKPMDVGGNRIYDTYIKNNRDFVAKGAAFRTYKLDGIQYATEVFLKKNVLEQYYG